MVQTRQKRQASGLEDGTTKTITPEAAQLAKRRKLVKGAVSHNEQVLGPTGKNVLSILLQKDNLYPVYQSLTTHLEIVDIIRLTRTCKALSRLYQNLRQSSWDIDSYLSRWFNNPLLVRRQAAELGAAIGGTAIYDFMNRQDRDDAVIVVYIGGYCRQRDDGFIYSSNRYLYGGQDGGSKKPDQLFQLLQGEGYSITSQGSASNWAESDMTPCSWWSGSFKLTKLTNTDKQCVNVVWSEDEDGLGWVLGRIRSTACLNLLFWDRCISIFPSATFDKKVAFIVGGRIKPSLMGERDPADMPSSSWLRRGLVHPPRRLVEHVHKKSLSRSVLWKRCRRIAGPEAWVIQTNTYTPNDLLPPSWVLDTAFMEVSVSEDWTPGLPQNVDLYTTKAMLPISRFPIFTSDLNFSSSSDKLCLMWNEFRSKMMKSHVFSKYKHLTVQERHRRRSSRNDIENLDDHEKQRRIDVIYDEIYWDMHRRRWMIPSGWYDDEAISPWWEKFKADFQRVTGDKAEVQEMELSKNAASHIPGLN